MAKKPEAASLSQKEKRFAVLSLTIALVGLSLLYAIPSVFISVGSLFYRKDLGQIPTFTGLANFASAILDKNLWASLTASLVFTLLSVVAQVLVAFALALFTYRSYRGVETLRWMLFSPYFFPTVVVIVAWHFFTEPSIGLLTLVMRSLGLPPIDFRSPQFALPAMIIVSTYEAFPFCYAIFLARLIQVPKPLYALAQMDGAGFYRIFTTVTWPQLKMTLIGVTGLRIFITALKFDVPWLVYASRAESRWSETFAVWIYRTAFEQLEGGKAYAATVTLLLFVAATVFLIHSIRKSRFELA